MAVTAPAIGFYYAAQKGQSLLLKEGQTVKQGDGLGMIETSTKKHTITAPVAGTLRVICAEDGKPVEYDQPLFFIEP